MSFKHTCARVLKKLSFLHNTLVLVAWLTVEILMVYHLYKHLHNGFKFDFGLLHSLDLWYYLGREFQFATAFNALNLLFYLDNKKHGKTFLLLFFHHLKGFVLYFVTFKVLNDDAHPKWTMVNLTVWTLLNVLESLNNFNQYTEHKSEFLEWLYYKVFMFLYPLLTVSELMLLTSSFGNLKGYDKYKSFPSAMPNKYNFTLNLHLVYKFLPAPMALCSTVVYFYKCKNS